jgi:DNA-3-methyladenine glycosylase I
MVPDMKSQTAVRCAWVDLSKPDYVAYHDEEWGVPQLDDNKLFEALCLEGAQAGLSWYTILKKREGYREVFSQFNLIEVASYSESDISALLSDSRIVRHEGKIRSVLSNAKVGLRCASELGSFREFIWNTWAGCSGDQRYKIFSSRMKKAGFKFVGPKTLEAFSQATGLVNDHSSECFRYPIINSLIERSNPTPICDGGG